MDKYAEFLRQRLNELEEWAYEDLELPAANIVKDYAQRTRADIAAKRKILDACVAILNDEEPEEPTALNLAGFTVRMLCEPFASHPEYPGERHG